MKIGIIGGSSISQIHGLEILDQIEMQTPFGYPSSAITHGLIEGVDVFFLQRHGDGHHIPPHQLNHRANIYAMKSLGVQILISLSAVGSFKKELAPGDVVVIDQFFDRTKGNIPQTFFEGDIVAHASFGSPVCNKLNTFLYNSIKILLERHNPNEVSVHKGGTYLNMEGPAFSTMAESQVYKSWGMSVIGMTNMPEAKLAREAQLPYQSLAFVTDYDSWHVTSMNVSVEIIFKTLTQNAQFASDIIRFTLPRLAKTDFKCPGCEDAMRFAIVTKPEKISTETRQKLHLLLPKHLQQE